jgi:hypothetical protein
MCIYSISTCTNKTYTTHIHDISYAKKYAQVIELMYILYLCMYKIGAT